MSRAGALLLSLVLAATGAGAAEPLRVATDGFRPAVYLENGHPAGALCDVLAEISRRTAIPIEIHLLPWARAMAETQAGRMDAIFPIFSSPQRQTAFAFSSEVLLGESVAWFARAGSDLEIGPDPAGAAGHAIAIVNHTSTGGLFDRTVQAGKLGDIQAVPDTTSLVRTLAAGRVELIAGFDQGIWAEAGQLGVRDRIRELTPAIEEVPAYLAFTRDRDMSAESRAIDAALKAMKKDGTYQKILARYFVARN